MKKWKLKRMLSILLTVAMLASVVPEIALAGNGEDDDASVTVRFAVSYGANVFYDAATSGTILIPQEITVPYFDLAIYGLEEYYYNPEYYSGGGQSAGTKEDAEGVVTTMHAFIYATEVFYCGIAPEEAGKGELAENLSNYISWSGGVGSSFMEFWDHGYNLNYYLNYEYPLGAPGWGSTSDQQALEDGDIITIHLIEDWSVWGSSFGLFAANDEDGEYTREDTVDKITVSQGDEVTLTLYHTAVGWSDYTTQYEAAEGINLSWAEADGISANVKDWNHESFAGMEESAYTDEEGKVTLDTSELEPGTYYIAAEGDIDYNNGLEVAPAVFELTVTQKGEDENQKAAKAVEEKIAGLGEVTLESEETIAEVRTAYDALTEVQKELVTNYEILTNAETVLSQLKKEAEEKAKEEAANKAAAKAVEEKIAELGEVTLESEEAIAEARSAYDALSEVQKQLVTNYETLTEAETTLSELKKAQEEKARKEAEEKAKEEAANKAAAKAVEEKIADLGEVTLESEETVSEARKAYDALSEVQKKLVTNYETLTEAETTLSELKKAEEEKAQKEAEEAKKKAEEEKSQKEAEEKAKEEAANKEAAKAVEEKIAAIGEVSLESEETVAETRKAYDDLTDEQKELVINYETLTGAEARLSELKNAEEEKAQKEAEEKAKEEAANKEAAKAVEEKIAGMGEVSLESEETVAETRKAYDDLTDEQKELVTNYETLTDAEAKLSELKKAEEEKAQEEAKKKAEEEQARKEAEEKAKGEAEEKAKEEAANKAAAKEAEEKIAAIGNVTLKSENKIKEARTAFDKLTSEQKKYVTVTYQKALTEAETTFAKQKAAVKKGKKVTVGTGIYKITKDSLKNGTVEYVKPTKQTQKTITVPRTVKIYGVTYKVTSIGNKAFNKCEKLTKLTISENVTKIGAYAFKDCTRLKSLTIKSKKMTTKTIHKNAFKGLTKTTTIKVPSSKKKAYTKLYKKCGLNKKVKIK
jgi:hypothetical protein